MEKIEAVLEAVERILDCEAKWGHESKRDAYALKLIWHSVQMSSGNTYSIEVAATGSEIDSMPDAVLVDGIVREVIRVIKETNMPDADRAIFEKIPGYSPDGWYDTDKARVERLRREEMLMDATRKLAEEAAIASIKDTVLKRSQPAPSLERP